MKLPTEVDAQNAVVTLAAWTRLRGERIRELLNREPLANPHHGHPVQ